MDSKGFGFTLKGPCDFKLEEFYAAPSEFFEPYYGELPNNLLYNFVLEYCISEYLYENDLVQCWYLFTGVRDDGDVYAPENLKSLQKFVMSSTDNKGVHFVMADGVSCLSMLRYA